MAAADSVHWVFHKFAYEGGMVAINTGTPLSAGMCVARGVDSTAHTRTAKSFMGTVDVSAFNIIGAVFSAEADYSSSHEISIHFSVAHPLCGWKGFPAGGDGAKNGPAAILLTVHAGGI